MISCHNVEKFKFKPRPWLHFQYRDLGGCLPSGGTLIVALNPFVGVI